MKRLMAALTPLGRSVACAPTVAPLEQQLGAPELGVLAAGLGQQIMAARKSHVRAVKWLTGAAKRGSLVDAASEKAKQELLSLSLQDAARVDLLNLLQQRGLTETDVDYSTQKLGRGGVIPET